MPEDRFGDLGKPARGDEEPARAGASTSDRPSAAEKLAALEQAESGGGAPGAPPHRDVRSFQRRYSWVVGVLVTVVIIGAGINAIPHPGLGTHGPPVGRPLPRFAAPNALGPIDGDPNVKQSAADKGQPNKTPACAVRGPGIVNVCELERNPVVMTFVGPGTTTCNRFLDRIQRLQPSFPQVSFAAVVSGRSKATVARLVRRHHWTLPVAVDRNHELFDLYRVAVCATTTFASRGGVVRHNKVLAQDLTDAQLRADVRRIGGARP